MLGSSISQVSTTNNNNSQIFPAYAGCGEIPMYTTLPLRVKKQVSTTTPYLMPCGIAFKSFLQTPRVSSFTSSSSYHEQCQGHRRTRENMGVTNNEIGMTPILYLLSTNYSRRLREGFLPSRINWSDSCSLRIPSDATFKFTRAFARSSFPSQ